MRLQESSPAAEDVDARGISAFIDAVEAIPGTEPHSMMILRHGRVIAAGWWAPYRADRPHLLYSLSKSFTATAAGLAAADGLLDLDGPVISYFPEFADAVTDSGILVRHVASMSTGHTSDTWLSAVTRDKPEPVRGFLQLPPDRTPGSVFCYNQSATYTLAAIVQKVTGESLIEYLQPRLFDPLGIEQAAWLQHPPGRNLGFSGLFTTTDAIARLGQLYLDGGVWDGKQLLPAWWVAEATRSHVSNAAEGFAADWQQGYGFQFWMSRHGYRGDGAFGQFCLVLPEQDAVVAITADTMQMQVVLDAAWQHLLPAFGASAPGTAHDEDLRERLARLAVPPPAGAYRPLTATTLAPEGGQCTDQRSLTSVTVSAAGDGFDVSLAEGDVTLELRCVPGRWTVSEPGAPVPTAVSGGWTGPDTLTIDVAFTETPHHFIVTCSPSAGSFAATWRTPPLHHGRLRTFQAPC